jgi:hypothetical protein
MQTKLLPATHMEESQREDMKVAVMAGMAGGRGLRAEAIPTTARMQCLLYLFFFPWSYRYSFSNSVLPTSYFLLLLGTPLL